MKKVFTIVFLFILHSVTSQAQFKVSTTIRETYTGYRIDESGGSLVLRGATGIDYTISSKIIDCTWKLNSIIYTKNGRKIIGHIYKQDTAFVYYTDGSNENKTLKISDIEKYEIDKNLTMGYPALGITLGSPGGWNIVYLYQFSFGGNFRIQGGGAEALYGIQANAGYNLIKIPSFELNLSLAGGHISKVHLEKLAPEFGIGNYAEDYNSPRDTWTYFGLTVDLNWGGFFVEAGYSIGKGIYKNGHALIQAGYVYRFL